MNAVGKNFSVIHVHNWTEIKFQVNFVTIFGHNKTPQKLDFNSNFWGALHKKAILLIHILKCDCFIPLGKPHLLMIRFTLHNSKASINLLYEYELHELVG